MSQRQLNFKRQQSLTKAQQALRDCEKYQWFCNKCVYRSNKGGCLAKDTVKLIKEVEQGHKDAFKVIVAGCRDFNNQSMVNRVMDRVLQGQIDKGRPIEVVSGKARGADRLGEKYADKRDWVVAEFPANWDKHGKSAGYKRNKEMSYYANGLVAFWDGKSRGTAHMIRLMLDKKKPVVVHSITKDRTLYCHKEEDKKMVLKALSNVLTNKLNVREIKKEIEEPVITTRVNCTFKEYKGDMFNLIGKVDVLCITTNGFVKKNGLAVMGAGCAKYARDNFKGIDAVLGKLLNQNGNVTQRLGKVSTTEIYSLPVKHNWWEEADIKLIVNSITKLVSEVNKKGYKKVVIPRPGCGNGKLKWDFVKMSIAPLLDERFIIASF